MIKVYTDGSGQPKSAYSYCTEDYRDKIVRSDRDLTNNQAEYLAVIEALKDIQDEHIIVLSDSQLVVNQLNHKYTINDPILKKMAEEVWRLCKGRKVEFIQIPRKENMADRLLRRL